VLEDVPSTDGKARALEPECRLAHRCRPDSARSCGPTI
jgi:hypothetical protein